MSLNGVGWESNPWREAYDFMPWQLAVNQRRSAVDPTVHKVWEPGAGGGGGQAFRKRRRTKWLLKEPCAKPNKFRISSTICSTDCQEWVAAKAVHTQPTANSKQQTALCMCREG